MTKFNLLRYKELLAENEVLRKTTKDKLLFDEPAFMELLSLKSTVETQVFYNHKNNYCDLIQKYLGETINSYGFQSQFLEMVQEDTEKSYKILKNFEELSTFSIDLELDDFSFLFQNMYEACLYAVEFEGEDEAMPENKFRDLIQKSFFKIEKYLNE